MANTLHLLTKTQIPNTLSALAKDSAVVLMQDAVYLALNPLPAELQNTKVFAIKSDLQARGLNPVTPNIQAIDYPQLVNLVLNFKNNVTW